MNNRLIAVCDQAISFEIYNEVEDGIIPLTANGELKNFKVGIEVLTNRVEPYEILNDINHCDRCKESGGPINCIFRL